MQRSLASSRTVFRFRGAAWLAAALLQLGSAPLLLSGSGCASSSQEFAADEAATRSGVTADEFRDRGFTALAARQYENASLLASDQDDRRSAITYLLDAAECWLLDGAASVAEVDVEKAAALATRLTMSSSHARTVAMRLDCLRGDLALVDGRPRAARESYEGALERSLGRERDLVVMRLSLLAEREGDRKRAKSWFGQLSNPSAPRVVELRKMLGVAAANGKATQAAPTASPQAVAKRAATASVSSPPILPRTAWGARRSRSNLDAMTSIWRITVHHTATKLGGTSTRLAAAAIKTFQRQHQDEKGWADIGYHFVIDPAGRIWEGRSLSYQGAHAGSPELNAGNVGIALIGDFTVQQPTASQKKSLADLLASLCARYHIDRSHVFTHQEIRPTGTECPGPALQRVIDSWRRGGVKAAF